MARSSKPLKWATRAKKGGRLEGIGRIGLWRESTHIYRVVHYLDYGADPFFAVVKRAKGRGRQVWETISRHSELAAAMRACEEHAAAGG